MKYYFKEYEKGYQLLKKKNKSIWAELFSEEFSFDKFDMLSFMEQALPLISIKNKHKRALEYGCGTGAGAYYLEQNGFIVDAIDISPTAIELAKEIANQRESKVNYILGDVCNSSLKNINYDLIVDNYCLQGIVTDDDRKRLFSFIHSNLSSIGYYLIGSVIFKEDRVYEDCYFDEESGKCYVEIIDKLNEYEDKIQINNKYYIPERKHPKPENLKLEVGKC
ncbi:MAG: class I SAM-dependent methyltransferase [Candidatus Cloacimonetes bacterium]|nr:class I SAM-dependent methyltransferase [Candidatus Cloacimonadota bacterium]